MRAGMLHTTLVMAFLLSFTHGQAAMGDPLSRETLNDAKIMRIFMISNDFEIRISQLANTLASAPEVKSLATRMMTDSTLAQKQALGIMKSSLIGLQETEMSKKLIKQGNLDLAKFQTLTGRAFDNEYIIKAIGAHKMFITTLDDQLIPDTTNPDLKLLLQNSRRIAKFHLDQALKVQALLHR